MAASLYIPVIGKNVSADFVAKKFLEANIGNVERVDFVVNKVKGRREAFVHFSEWFASETANKLKSQLEISMSTGEQCQFKYNNDTQQYWPLLVNKKPLAKDSPERKSNDIYNLENGLEYRIADMQKQIEQLTFMTKLHDANIRFILHNLNRDEPAHPQLKRFKSDDATASVM